MKPASDLNGVLFSMGSLSNEEASEHACGKVAPSTIGSPCTVISTLNFNACILIEYLDFWHFNPC